MGSEEAATVEATGLAAAVTVAVAVMGLAVAGSVVATTARFRCRRCTRRSRSRLLGRTE